MRSLRLQFAIEGAVNAYYSLQHAQCTLTICYRMRSEPLLFVAASEVCDYYYNLLTNALSAIPNC